MALRPGRNPAAGHRVPTAVIVDDYPVMRELLKEFMHRAGYEVVGEAGSARELLAGIERWAPEVLVLDVLLPDANAAEVTRKVLATLPQTRVLVVREPLPLGQERTRRDGGQRQREDDRGPHGGEPPARPGSAPTVSRSDAHPRRWSQSALLGRLSYVWR